MAMFGVLIHSNLWQYMYPAVIVISSHKLATWT